MQAGDSLAIINCSPPASQTRHNLILSVGLWCVLDILFRRIFQGLNIANKFPSSLGGCGFLLAILLLSTRDNKLHRVLSPGAAALAKWLPVFFVPSLVTLPLLGGVSSLGGSVEVKREYYTKKRFTYGLTHSTIRFANFFFIFAFVSIQIILCVDSENVCNHRRWVLL